MFTILRILFSSVFAIAVIFAIFYFLPTDIKLKGIETVTGIVPESIKEDVQELILTPPEKRDKILRELKKSLEKLDEIDSSNKTPEAVLDEIKTEIKKTKKIAENLKDINNDASITDIITKKLIEKLIDGRADVKKNSTQDNCNCKPEKDKQP